MASSETASPADASDCRFHGRVKWFDQSKGYGFVSVSKPVPEDILVHISALKRFGLEHVDEDDWLEFTALAGPKGRHVDAIHAHQPGMRAKRPFEPVIVKWFNPEKGFGFVCRVDDEADIFVHASVVRRTGLETLEANMPLNARIVSGAKGHYVDAIQSPAGEAT